MTAPRARLENSARTAPPPSRVEFSTPPLVSASGSPPPCWTSAIIASFGGGQKACDAGAAPAHRLVARSHRPLLLVGKGQHGFDARFRENRRGDRERRNAARIIHEAGKEAALPQVVKGRQGRDPIARPKLDVRGHGSKEGRPGGRFNPALGDHAIAVRFKIIAVRVRGAFAVMHEMHAIGNKRNAPALRLAAQGS